jgi:hypothetical protein
MFAFAPAKRKPPAVRDPLGLNLIGRVFLSDSPGAVDKEHTILRTGDPREYMKEGTKIPVPMLEFVETTNVDKPDRLVRQSTVKEARGWLKMHDKHLHDATTMGDVGTVEAEAVLLPLLKMGPIEIEQARSVQLLRMSVREREAAKRGPDFMDVLAERRKKNPSGQPKASTKLRDETVLAPLSGMTKSKVVDARRDSSLEIQTAFRVLLSKISACRKTKRWPRSDIIRVLKGKTLKIRKRHLKCGIDIPTGCRDCHRAEVSMTEQAKWRTEEVEEISTLVDDLKIIIKGFNISDLRKEMPNLQPIPGMWVYDAHPAGVKLTDRRARWVANGARDPDKGKEESYSPVGQLVTARVLMCIINQLDMDLVLFDMGKAFWKGRLNRKAVYMWAAEGFAEFEGEVWKILGPIQGLDDSGKTFYQTMSEFMRLIGFKHFHADPSFFRRLRGPGIVHEYPTHTDSPEWRRSAPNEDFAGPHVESLYPEFTSALPAPNVYGTAAPDHKVPMGPLSAAEIAGMRMDDSSAGVLQHLKTMMEGGKNSKFWCELALWCVDDVAIGTYDKEAIIGDLTRRFERVTCHVNGEMFLGFDITHDKETNLLVVSIINEPNNSGMIGAVTSTLHLHCTRVVLYNAARATCATTPAA